MLFGTLLTAVAHACVLTPKAILSPRRQRALVPARTLLVYLARVWKPLTMRELGGHLQRDPSMISRRDATVEALIRQMIITRPS